MPQPPLPLNDADVASLERATLDAVAPQEVQALDAWLLPFDSSTIGRAKSAVPLRHHSLPADVVPAICGHYAARGLPAVFRVADLAGLAPLHAQLRQHGFHTKEPAVCVQVASIGDVLALPSSTPADVFETPVAAWASVYTAAGFDPVDGAQRVQSLSRSAHCVYAAVTQDGASLSAGVAALSQGWASLHGIRTLEHTRGQGLASHVLVALARHARERGLERIFLQVEEDNVPALALYRRAGFVTAWRYHYWQGD